MKRLVALMMCAVSLGAAAQFPNLPYNPDENGDGLIGVVDLQGLLANYGNEFSSAILSSDSNTAVIETGEGLNYLECHLSCSVLPGNWKVISENSAALALNSITTSIGSSYAWIEMSEYNYSSGYGALLATMVNESGGVYTQSGSDLDNEHQCFCEARQLPRMEYFKCAADLTSEYSVRVEQCVTCTNTKLAEGWQLLPPGGSSTVQDLWRWAE